MRRDLDSKENFAVSDAEIAETLWQVGPLKPLPSTQWIKRHCLFFSCWFFFLLTNSLLVRTRIDKLSYGGKHFWSENEKVYTDIFSNISTLTTEYIYYFSPIKEWLWFLIWTCLNVQQCMPRPKIISLIFFFFFWEAQVRVLHRYLSGEQISLERMIVEN